MITIEERAESGILILEPGERLTLEHGEELLTAIQSATREYAPVVVVNLHNTRTVDSTGIGVLVKSLKHLSSVGGRLCLAGLRPEILRTFQLMNLHQVFEIFDTVDLACKRYTIHRV